MGLAEAWPGPIFLVELVRLTKLRRARLEPCSIAFDNHASEVFLTDGHVKFTLSGGKTDEQTFKAGESRWTKAGKHPPENLEDKPFALVLVERKARPKTK